MLLPDTYLDTFYIVIKRYYLTIIVIIVLILLTDTNIKNKIWECIFQLLLGQYPDTETLFISDIILKTFQIIDVSVNIEESLQKRNKASKYKII